MLGRRALPAGRITRLGATLGLPHGLLALAILVSASACNGQKQEATADKAPTATQAKYMEPRFPAYLRRPDSVDALMATARGFARNKAWRGGLGLGAVNPGETVLIVHDADAEPMILEAIGRAAAERKFTIIFEPDYELVGVSKEDAREYRKLRRSFTAEKGYMEASNWIETQFPQPDPVKAWLKERRPDLYDALYPASRDMSPRMKAIWEKLQRNSVGLAIQGFLKKNPHVRGVYWGKGGGPGAMRALYPMDKQYMGFFTADNRWEMMSAIPEYPSDVWLVAEESAMEPIAYVDRIEVTDPEGTNVWADITEDMAQRWTKGIYQRGHLYLFPNQATGRFGYSVVDYPAFQGQWIPREPMSLINGVVAATNGHTGFFPRMEVHYKDGYAVDVKGGGVYGDTLQEMMKLPKIHDVTYPFHEHKGFFFLYEIASGTHPKWFRNPTTMAEGALSPERNRSGVIHWGLGLRLWHDPDRPVESPSWLKFTAEHNLPRDHGFHMHSYFPTYKVHLRHTSRWANVIEGGRMKSLDAPEVRALASRYGDPDRLLAEDWVPEMPGINAPGNYLIDYAPNSWPVSKRVIDQAVAGTYGHYFPAATSRATPPAAAEKKGTQE